MQKRTSTSTLLFRALALNILSNALLYAGHLVIARRLVRDDYAVFTVVISFVSLMALFADIGSTSHFVRKFSEAGAKAEKGEGDERGVLLGSLLGFRIILSLLVSIAIIVLAPILGYTSYERHLMVIMLVVLFISSRIPIVRTIGESFLRGANKYPLVSLYAAIDALVFTGMLYFYADNTLDLEGAVWIYTFCHIPGVILLWYSIYKYARTERLRISFRLKTILEVLKEGMPLILSSVFLAIHNYADPLLLDKLSSPSQVSAFAAGLRILSALIFIPLVFSSIISPLITRAVLHNNIEEIKLLLYRSFRLLVIIAIAVALLISSASESFVHILFGSGKYNDAAPIVVIFGWSFIPIFFGNFLMEVAIAEGKLWFGTIYWAVAMASSVLLDIILIPHHGAIGSAMAKAAGVSASAIVLTILSYQLIVVDRKRFLFFLSKMLLVLGCCLILQQLLIRLAFNELGIAVIISSFFLLLSVLTKAIRVREIISFSKNFLSRT